MTQEELQTLVEDEIASCLGHIKRGESVIFYEGKLSGLTLMREKLRLLTPRVPDVATSWRCGCGWVNGESVKLCSACGTQRR